eukprot:TRINITY_DN69693_c0_g1_i1.p1 TRINITY_DN69693_c0_g1~~TRINITY_DN69693_c0_g1_i1.p1  ORF type:complete len:143 (+),score=18.09 TRINITY_DN69693_c0_g1_i1:64-429(+)
MAYFIVTVSVLLSALVGNFVAGTSQVPRAPVCHEISCADIECLSPMELRRSDDQCCPICWAPDHVIGLDRHEAGERSMFRRDAHPAAPTSCQGARCFAPHCLPGQHEGHVTGRCCASCITR